MRLDALGLLLSGLAGQEAMEKSKKQIQILYKISNLYISMYRHICCVGNTVTYTVDQTYYQLGVGGNDVLKKHASNTNGI